MATDNYLTEKAQVLLDCFDNRTQNEFIEFCKEVSQIEADVYILMARKASCFFNCLEKLGLIHFNGYVTSERVLDMRREWLTNKRVLIIDDAIVSGTSINRTIRALRESNVKSIDVRVLTVNQKWFQKDLLTDDEGNDYYQNRCNVASNEKCIDLCYRIVKAILLQPRPYDIDFPFFLGVELKPDEYNQAFNMSDWNTYDVSTVEQRKQNVYSVSIMPSASAIRDFSRRMNCALDNNTLVKIRTYTVHHIKNKDTYSVRIVPMIVFDRIDKEYIDEMFNTIVSNSGGSLGVDDFPSSSSRLRFVQFYLSYKFACYWMSRLPDSIRNKWQATSLEDRNVSFIFPSGIDEKVKHICESDIIVMPNWKKNENGCLQEHKEYKPSKITTIDPISLETRLIRPFLDMYYQKEIPCRTLVKREGKKAFNCKENGDLLQRLNVGLTIGDLVSIINDAEAYYDIRTKVSLFIDRSIDMGIIVPITQETENCVFRAFRHGEIKKYGMEIGKNRMISSMIIRTSLKNTVSLLA